MFDVVMSLKILGVVALVEVGLWLAATRTKSQWYKHNPGVKKGSIKFDQLPEHKQGMTSMTPRSPGSFVFLIQKFKIIATIFLPCEYEFLGQSFSGGL